MDIKFKTILYVSLWPWEDLWQRPQHIAVNLSRTHNVIFTSAIPYKSKNGTLNLFNKFRVNKFSDTLQILSYFFLPSWKFPFIKNFNYNSWLNKLNTYLSNNNIEVDILWVTSPDHIIFCDKLNAKNIVYDCMDNFGMFEARLKPLENYLFRKADIVFASAKLLVDNARSFNNNVHLIPNAVDVDVFNSVLSNEHSIPEDLIGIPNTKIGFYGNLGTWLDYSVISEISNLEGISIVLIGSINSAEARNLINHESVYYIGEKEYRDLPNYLANINVWILPFQDNELTRAVDPVKIYEYLAAGRDVISTPLPAINQHSEFIHICSPLDFPSKVLDAINNPKTYDQRMKASLLMKKHTWESRVNDITFILNHIE